MNSKFVETGLTYAEDGAAYCPIERKRRGPLALVASMSVLFLGAGFLAYSMMSSPKPVTAPLSAAPEPLSLAEATEEPASAAVAKAERTVEEVLAESRAARAGVTQPAATAQVSTSTEERGFLPRLKPTTASASEEIADTSDPLPRLKPQAETVAIVQPAVPKPLRLGTAQLASVDDRPPTFFSDSEFAKRPSVNASPAALTFASDIATPLDNVRVVIRRGENFVDTLKRAGVSQIDSNKAAYAFGEHYNLRQLRPGQAFNLTLSQPNQTLFQLAANNSNSEPYLMGLEFRSDAQSRVKMRRDASGGFIAEKKVIPLTTRTMAISGRINGSLYLSAKAVGAPDNVIADLAGAFSYDVDFQREIFGGDEFEALFEAHYDDQGALVSTGNILYARLNWRGRSKEKGYYRFSPNGDERWDFYDATGQSAKRLLMKTPIDGARLSSGFGTRKHPILGYRRAHKGVDFAASRGTPIMAAGDGTIERANVYGSFGNYVRIRHANGYKTAYAHLNGFARGIRSGKYVRQGDIIGYVGTTGRSTGPHLHYEVHLNGTAVNPQTLKINTTGKALAGAELDRFIMHRDIIDAMRFPEAAEKTNELLADGTGATGNSL